MSGKDPVLHRRLRFPGGIVDVLLVRNDARGARALRRALRPRDRRRVERRRRSEDRRAALLGSALLRRALALRGARPGPDALLQRPARRPLHRTVDGRPLSLSVSHSPGWVAVAATGGPGRRVGVDVEDRGRPVDPRVARRLPGGTLPAAARGLLGRWCAVEAALKADGRGLAALDRLRDAPGGRLRFTDRPGEPVLVRAIPRLPPGCVGAVAVGRRTLRSGRGPERGPDQEPRR
ncbi:MAG: hypothetical protein V2J02_04210 [Pseudomonadales bacterium]|nr:hypothetical protein [Pseudomonadales bacterium]